MSKIGRGTLFAVLLLGVSLGCGDFSSAVWIMLCIGFYHVGMSEGKDSK